MYLCNMQAMLTPSGATNTQRLTVVQRQSIELATRVQDRGSQSRVGHFALSVVCVSEIFVTLLYVN